MWESPDAAWAALARPDAPRQVVRVREADVVNGSSLLDVVRPYDTPARLGAMREAMRAARGRLAFGDGTAARHLAAGILRAV